MKNGFMSLLVIITIIAIVGGIFMHVFGFGGEDSKKITKEDSFTNVQDIRVEANLFNLKIEESTSGAVEVRYEGLEKLAPDFSYDPSDKKLEIIQKSKYTSIKKVNELNGKCELTVRVPKDAYYDRIKVTLSLGNIEAKSLGAKEIYIDADLGNVEADKITAEYVDVDASLGNVVLKKASFNNIDVEASLGNVEIESINKVTDYEIDAETSLGNTKVEGQKVSSEYHSDGTAGKIRIDCSLGDVDLYTGA